MQQLSTIYPDHLQPSHRCGVTSPHWRRFDRNHDGIISKEELLALFDKIMPDFKDVDRLLQQMDTNHDGLIQYEARSEWYDFFAEP
jgi:hypothetical protein